MISFARHRRKLSGQMLYLIARYTPQMGARWHEPARFAGEFEQWARSRL